MAQSTFRLLCAHHAENEAFYKLLNYESEQISRQGRRRDGNRPVPFTLRNKRPLTAATLSHVGSDPCPRALGAGRGHAVPFTARTEPPWSETAHEAAPDGGWQLAPTSVWGAPEGRGLKPEEEACLACGFQLARH